MGYGRVIKNSTYYSRKRVPMKRRRECKTNYKKRHTMIRQNLMKPNYQQTRFVVRITNRYVICQMVKAYPRGDVTLCSASSQELPNYKYSLGLKNFSACYLTGRLLGHRVMRQSRLHKIYKGISGLDVVVDQRQSASAANLGQAFLERNLVNQPATYKAILDMGLRRPTKGSKIFAALKGCCDAGVFIPHKPKLFFGFDSKKQQLDTESLSERIRGVKLAQYAADILKEKKASVASSNSAEESNVKPQEHQFSKWYENAAVFPALFDQTLDNIRKNPKRMKMVKKQSKKPMPPAAKLRKESKKSYDQRMADINEQKSAWIESLEVNA